MSKPQTNDFPLFSETHEPNSSNSGLPKPNTLGSFLIRFIGLVQTTRDESQFLTKILALISSFMPCDIVEINRLDENQGYFIPLRWGTSGASSFLKKHAMNRYPLGKGFTGWLAEHRQPLLIEDTSKQKVPQPFSGLKTFPFRSFLGVPIEWEDQLIGTLELAHLEREAYTIPHLELLRVIASQLSLAILHFQLGDHLQTHDQQTKLIEAIGQTTAKIKDLDDVWSDFNPTLFDSNEINLLGVLLEVEPGEALSTPNLYSHDGDSWTSRAISLTHPITGDLDAIWRYQDYWVCNALNETILDDLTLQEVVQLGSIKRLLIIPLHIGSQRFGLLLMGRRGDQPEFDEHEIKALLQLSQQAAVVLFSSLQLKVALTSLDEGQAPDQLSGSFDQRMDINAEQMSELFRLSAELSATLDLDRSLDQVFRLCNHLLSADRSLLLTYNIETTRFSSRQIMPEVSAGAALPTTELVAAGQIVAEWISDRQQTLLLDDLHTDDRFNFGGYKSLCAVPCLAGSDLTGVLIFLSERASAFSSNELQIAQVVARQLASALNNSQLYSVIREQADRLGSMLRSQQIETSQSNAILESIGDGVLVTDTELNVILFNSAAERILNLPSKQVLGKEVLEFAGIFGSEAIGWGKTIKEWRRGPPEDHRRTTRPERVHLEDGRVISVLPAPVVIGGDFIGTVSIFRDISRDVEVDRLKSEFVATVSHELRTPMTSIKGFVDLMLMGAAGELSEQQKHFLDIVRTNTNRLEILVNDLLDISRIEAGKASLVFQELDVHQLLAEMEQYVQHRIQEENKQMDFVVDAPKILPPIWGDLERVRQILANIIENSFNYTPESGLICMNVRQVDGHIEIEVRDNGMGISLEEQERIFERFYRGEQALIMGVSGTGLGLAIVLNLVEMHQGRIWVTSAGRGHGTTFTVSLPSALSTSTTPGK